jgi:hypothetical protein
MRIVENGKTHDVDPNDVDDLDEISGGEQLKLVWCETHKTYEWHWLERN